MSTVLSASALIPDLYAVDEDRDSYDDLQYDLYNLMAADLHEIPMSAKEDIENELLEISTRTTQMLVRKIFQCQVEKSESGPLAVLPEEVSRLPRAQHVPEPKPETKWEKFAKDKGIQKRKKERMIYDDLTETYAPRYGYKRAKSGIEEHAIVEVKPGQDPHADPWAVAATDKKARVKKNAKNERLNITRALKKSGKGAPTITKYEPASVPGIPIEMTKTKGKRGKEGLRTALQLAQHSTASMGRFDERREGEPEKKILGKKRNFRDNISSTDADKKSMKANLRIVSDKIDKKARGVTNSLAAYEGIIPDAPTDTFKKKKGKQAPTLNQKKKTKR